MPDMTETAVTQYPLLPLRDVVVFPHMVIPLFVGRAKSIKAMETAMEAGKSILLVAQKSAAKDDPGPEDMYEIGCVSGILQMLKLPDGTVKVLVEGGSRAPSALPWQGTDANLRRISLFATTQQYYPTHQKFGRAVNGRLQQSL